MEALGQRPPMSVPLFVCQRLPIRLQSNKGTLTPNLDSLVPEIFDIVVRELSHSVSSFPLVDEKRPPSRLLTEYGC